MESCRSRHTASSQVTAQAAGHPCQRPLLIPLPVVSHAEGADQAHQGHLPRRHAASLGRSSSSIELRRRNRPTGATGGSRRDRELTGGSPPTVISHNVDSPFTASPCHHGPVDNLTESSPGVENAGAEAPAGGSPPQSTPPTAEGPPSEPWAAPASGPFPGYGPPPGQGPPLGYGWTPWPEPGRFSSSSGPPHRGFSGVLRSVAVAWIVAGVLLLTVVGLSVALASGARAHPGSRPLVAASLRTPGGHFPAPASSVGTRGIWASSAPWPA